MSASRLVVALDQNTLVDALRLAKRIQHVIRTVKVGSILFTRTGPDVIRRLRLMGFEVMLDLKFFDIPSTVEGSVRAAVHHRVSILTIHASGTEAMLEASVRGARLEAARLHLPRPTLLGVTVLTSVGSVPQRTLKKQVRLLAQRALRAGCDGVVASAREAGFLREDLGKRAKIFCPGIRPAKSARADQARVSTPGEALIAGADALIIGRPITAAGDPAQAARRILAEMESVADVKS